MKAIAAMDILPRLSCGALGRILNNLRRDKEASVAGGGLERMFGTIGRRLPNGSFHLHRRHSRGCRSHRRNFRRTGGRVLSSTAPIRFPARGARQ